VGSGRRQRAAGAESGKWVFDVEGQAKGEGFNTENTEGTEKDKNESEEGEENKKIQIGSGGPEWLL
jgi:hypothetical protein